MATPVHQPQILVINDSPELQSLFKTLLGGEGYLVTCLDSLSADLDTTVSRTPDLVMMDYPWSTEDHNCPLLLSLRSDQRTSGIPLILYPGAFRQSVEIADHLTAMGILFTRKSFDIDEMLYLVGDTLQHHHGTGHGQAQSVGDLPGSGPTTAQHSH